MKHDSKYVIRTILMTFSLSGALVLAGCGGSSGGTANTGTAAAPAATLAGTFTDAPVAGAKYVTSSGSGGCVASSPCTTGAQGQFSYASGDTITFSAAGVTLGTTSALQPLADGSTTVTPISLVSGATLPSDPGPTAIAQFLQTLNTVAVSASGSNATGVLTMPTDPAVLAKIQTGLAGAGVTSTSSVATVLTKLQTALNASFGANQFTVVPANAATAALTQGLNSTGIAGTVWSGPCACGTSKQVTVYFQPDGTLTGFTDDGNLLAGSWTGSLTAGGGVTVHVTSPGGKYATGTFTATAGTVTAYTAAGAVDGTITLTKITASSVSTANSPYMGGWYATYTPNAARVAAGDHSGTAYIIAAPDGTLYGITDGSTKAFTGTWTVASGQATASWTDTNAIGLSMNLATLTGTVTVDGQPGGTLALSRTGMLTRKNNQNYTGTPIPLLLNVTVSWANNAGSSTVTNFALGLNVLDASGALVSSTVRSESTAPQYNGVRTTVTDNIGVAYPTGAGVTYSLSVGGANCTIAGGSGSISDANSGNPSAYPAVNVTCDPNSTVQTIPLLLKVITTWGNTYPAPGYGLALMVNDPNGGQLAGGFVQQNIVVPVSTTTTTTSLCGGPFLLDFVCTSVSGSSSVTTTTNISASYPKGDAASYSLTTGSSYCAITAGGSGSVVDANSGNAAAYPTVSVTCP